LFNKIIALPNAVLVTSYQAQLVLDALAIAKPAHQQTNVSIVKLDSFCNKDHATPFAHQEQSLITILTHAFLAIVLAKLVLITQAHVQAVNQGEDI
jgi:hypothetical protein